MLSYLEIAKKAPIVAKEIERLLEDETITCRQNWTSEALVTWAAWLAEADIILDEPIEFFETELRPIETTKVSEYAGMYLKTIVSTKIHQETGGWEVYTVEWWIKQEEKAIEGLRNLRQALLQRGDITK